MELSKVRGKTKIATETYMSYDEGEICSFNKEIYQFRKS